MKLFFHLALPLMLLILSCNQQPSAGGSTTKPGAAEREKIAADIVSNLSQKNYAAVRKNFAKIMLDGLPEQKIKDSWEGLLGKVGEFQKVISTEETQVQGYTVVKKRCQFASENASVQVTFNNENQVIGLFLKL